MGLISFVGRRRNPTSLNLIVRHLEVLMEYATQASKLRRFLARHWVRRTLLLMLALVVIQYVTMATVFLRREASHRTHIALIVVWVVAVIAVFLLARAWQSIKSPPGPTDGV